jgi:hypothetical protein
MKKLYMFCTLFSLIYISEKLLLRSVSGSVIIIGSRFEQFTYTVGREDCFLVVLD